MKTTDTPLYKLIFLLLVGALTANGSWQAKRGPDGRIVNYGPQCSLDRGSDGRLICTPEGWTQQTGSDGRMVAIPPGGNALAGPDNRLIPIPEGWSFTVGPDLREASPFHPTEQPPKGQTIE